MAEAESNESPQMDLSDVAQRVGQLVGGGQLWEPCAKSDIRRWVMAMDYVNPIHWDQEFAANTKFGDIIAPQSMAVALDYGHGCQPACVGNIPGSHLIFGGEEWWWYGTHVRPGDNTASTPATTSVLTRYRRAISRTSLLASAYHSRPWVSSCSVRASQTFRMRRRIAL